MRKKRVTALFLVLAMLLCSLPVSAAEGSWLLPKVKDHPGFADVTGTWCESYVKTVYEAGLMEGTSAERFDAVSHLTHAQITVIGARLYSLLTGGSVPETDPDAPWWRPSYDLLVDAGVLALNNDGEYHEELHWFDPTADMPCRRRFFVQLLGTVLEKANVALPEYNHVTLIPDLPDDTTGYIYGFYNSGILNGADPYGGFHGSEDLTRGQAAAMLARIIDPELRLRFELSDFDVCDDLLGVEHDAVLLTVDGIDITAGQMGRYLAVWFRAPYLTPEEGLDHAINAVKRNIAARRLAEELGYSIDEELLETAKAETLELDGYWGTTADGLLWERMRELYESALHPYILEKYGDRSYLSGINQELEAKAETLTVIRSELLGSMDLSAVKSKCANCPVSWVE